MNSDCRLQIVDCRLKNSSMRRAFTLIELLLVLVILATLAAIVVPRLAGKGQQAKIGAAQADIAQLGLSLSNFEVDCSRFPTTEEGLGAHRSAECMPGMPAGVPGCICVARQCCTAPPYNSLLRLELSSCAF